MKSPAKYTRSEAVEAMQWTGENFEELRDWAAKHGTRIKLDNPLSKTVAIVDKLALFAWAKNLGTWFVTGEREMRTYSSEEFQTTYKPAELAETKEK